MIDKLNRVYAVSAIFQLTNGGQRSDVMKYKRPTGLNGHLSIRDFTLTSCQKGAYLYINSPIIE